jgi:(p)ppGpp synthase/HD superfamily hydrolase
VAEPALAYIRELESNVEACKQGKEELRSELSAALHNAACWQKRATEAEERTKASAQIELAMNIGAGAFITQQPHSKLARLLKTWVDAHDSWMEKCKTLQKQRAEGPDNVPIEGVGQLVIARIEATIGKPPSPVQLKFNGDKYVPKGRLEESERQYRQLLVRLREIEATVQEALDGI